MRTLAVRDGDLVIAGSRYGMVEGIARAQQQIGLALREPFASDRFHTQWGSVLPNWIGTVLDRSLPQQIQSEVTRIVKDFILRQNETIKTRAAAGLRANVTPEEMIVEIVSVTVYTNQDAATVKVVLRTASRQEFTILTTPGSTT